MAAAKQQEEKRVQFLRRMVALPHNRHCFDCGQRGPTYVNMTIGSYVCTACSGILRGINPPHRVKSVSMASFTQEEIDLLTQRGNEYNKQVWLALHDTKEPPVMDTKDEIKVRDYLTQKYEKKRWYQAPTDGLAEAAKVMNNQSPQQHAGAGSALRRPMVGGFRIQMGSAPSSASSMPKTIPTPAASLSQASAPVSVPVAAPAHQPLTAQNSGSTTADLLSDVFGAAKPAVVAAPTNDFNQPNFANFGGMPASSNAASFPIPTQNASNPAPAVMSNNPLISTEFEAPVLDSTPSVIDTVDPSGGMMPVSNSNQWSTPAAAPAPTSVGGGDKYSMLTGLFSDMTSEPAPVSAPPPAAAATGGLNWNTVNWNSGAPGASQPAANVMGSSPSAGMSWGAQQPSSQPTQPASNMFGAGLQPAVPTSNSGWGVAPAVSSGVNPFLAGSNGVHTFGGFPGVAHGNPNAGGFPPQQPQPIFQAAGAGYNPYGAQPATPQFSAGNSAMGQMQNGASNQWGAAPAGSQWGGGMATASANQWGVPPNKQATSVNPFLMQTHAAPVPQQSMATNPFL